MPIQNPDDAVEVEERIRRIFAASSQERTAAIRRLFVEVLDFDAASGEVSLEGAPGSVGLPGLAHRIAELDGVHVLHVALPVPGPHTGADRVRKAEVDAAARLIADQLGDDLLLVFTNPSASQLHLILPSFTGSRPTLRRMVVERDLPRRTAVQQVSNIYWRYRARGSIRAALEEAFDVGPVTREFFAEYKRIFDAAEASVSGFQDTDEGREERRSFVQTLFNRLMFVYFLQRKGWLTFKGDKDYLNALWRDYPADSDGANFFAQRLDPLFFAGLNNPQSRDLNDNNIVLRSLIGEVPFLNGGLFEQTDLDRRGGVSVPDSAIEQVLGGLFDRFNFTVMESTPFDIEVAVDPEMLGKVFEELVTGRHESGAYYTPRPVVSFMCREALKGYLEGQDTGLDAEAIAQFVDRHDPSGLTLAAARRISEALDEVKVVDPACGSGAYLLGMMQELVELQATLYSEQLKATPRDLYELKLHIIQRNLYGVDIDKFAVNIAMLRMWLSLAIDYEGDRPEPLPNLDLKVVRGDSLLGPDPGAGVEVQGALGQDPEQFRRLGQLKAEYMRASLGPDKERLKAAIQQTEAGIREALGVVGAAEDMVDWRVEFAEVFAANRGFDIAIANPPYVQLQKDGGRLGRLYKDAGYATFARTGDIYQLFYERGCQLLRPSGGLLAYITSNSWLKAEYGKLLRRYFSEKNTPLLLLELGKDVFESAIVDSGVLLLRVGGPGSAFRAVDMDRLRTKDFPPDESLWGLARPDGDAPWSILSHAEQSIMDKMRSIGTPLKEWDVRINYGIKTGYNPAFIVDTIMKEALVAADPKSADILKPVLRGRDIQRYQAQWAGLWLITTFPPMQLNIEDYPGIKNHLLSFGKDRLEQSGKVLRGGGKARKKTQNSWFEIQDSIAYSKDFAKEKLFWMDMSPEGRFAYSDTEMYCNNKGFIMTGRSLKYLCAVLNSNIITWFIKNSARTTGMGLTQWERFSVERIPIPKISAAKQRPFIRLVDRILKEKAADPEADTEPLEWEIDRLVYDLYGLTEEEDTAVERSLGLIHQTDEEEDQAIARAIEAAKAEERGSMEELREILREWNEAGA